jgi:hypothetical protein
MARNRSRTPITEAKRALVLKAAMKRALTSASADEPGPKRACVRGSRNRFHSRTSKCHLRCRGRGPPCLKRYSSPAADVALLADNKASDKLREVQHGRRSKHVMPEDVANVQGGGAQDSKLIIVFEDQYLNAMGEATEFTIDGEGVPGYPQRRSIEYNGPIDATETVLLYNRAAGPWPLQSAADDGFMLIDADGLVPLEGQFVYGRWSANDGFAAGYYRGVVAVREQ